MITSYPLPSKYAVNAVNAVNAFADSVASNIGDEIRYINACKKCGVKIFAVT